MQKVLGIGGFFFRAKDPKALLSWYTNHLGIDISEAVWQQRGGPTVFAPFRENTDYFPANKQWMINFRVDDLDAMMAQLRSAGIAMETRPDEWDQPETGRFCRIHDPEGNQIELWEPPPHGALAETDA